MPPLELLSLLNPGHWFDGNPGPPSPFYVLLALLLAVGTAASLFYAFLYVPRRYRDHAFKTLLFGRFGQAFAGIFAVGLVLLALRYLAVPILSARVLLYLDLLAALGLAGFAVYYFTQRYARRLAAFEAEELRRRYLPRPVSARTKKKRKNK